MRYKLIFELQGSSLELRSLTSISVDLVTFHNFPNLCQYSIFCKLSGDGLLVVRWSVISLSIAFEGHLQAKDPPESL